MPLSSRPLTNRRRPSLWAAIARCRAVAPKVLRLTTYLLVLGVVSGVFLARSVWGSIGEKSLAVGRQLRQLGELPEGAHVVRLNGERLYIASRVSDQPMKEVLDHFEADCLAHGGGFEEAYAQLPIEARTKLQANPLWQQRLGIVREESETDGSITCIAQAGSGGFLAAVERLQQFVETGDAGAVGELRHAYVSKTKTGKTHLLASWTQGSFNINKFVGIDAANGDLPGSDPVGAPRPPNSQRLFTAQVDQAPLMIVTYATSTDAHEMLTTYSEQIEKAGWTPVLGKSVLPGRMFERQGVTLVVGIQHDEHLKRNIVSTVQSFAIGAHP